MKVVCLHRNYIFINRIGKSPFSFNYVFFCTLEISSICMLSQPRIYLFLILCMPWLYIQFMCWWNSNISLQSSLLSARYIQIPTRPPHFISKLFNSKCKYSSYIVPSWYPHISEGHSYPYSHGRGTPWNQLDSFLFLTPGIWSIIKSHGLWSCMHWPLFCLSTVSNLD